jgi:hypothetical protein
MKRTGALLAIWISSGALASAGCHSRAVDGPRPDGSAGTLGIDGSVGPDAEATNQRDGAGPGADVAVTVPDGGDSRYSACVAYFRAQVNRSNTCAGLAPVADSAPTLTDQCPDIEFAPGSLRTVEGLYACAQAWATLPCDQYQAHKVPDCASAGALTDGSRCISNVQCKSAHCKLVAGALTACGTCAPRSPAGGPCMATDDCPYDQSCDNGYCGPYPRQPNVGESCEGNQICAGTGICRPDSAGKRTCVGPAKLGESCATFKYCSYPDAFCNQALVCAPRPAPGMPCQKDNDNTLVCATSARCDTSAPGGPTCAPLPGPGEVCHPGTTRTLEQFDCANGMACVCTLSPCYEGVCQRRLQLGDACGAPNGFCVPGTRCQGGRCVVDEKRDRMTELCGP